jgi:hypothetical protein
MSHLSILVICSSLFVAKVSVSQKKWDGGGGNNLWTNAQNWTGNTVPVSTDDIVLDNSLIAVSYTIVLPSSSTTVKTVTISPASGKTIELDLPPQNISMPGFTITGPGYGLTLNSGGIFKNSSGASSGNAVKITDSIRINDDGKYVHNSSSGHATNVQQLSMLPGTEKGIFEFDIPVASSTLSFSGRTFGRLLLSASAAGGTANYTAVGTSRVVIRNNLELNTGVNLSLNFSDTIFVLNNFNQSSGTLNLGNSTRSVDFYIGLNFIQDFAGIITETGTAVQKIELGGVKDHVVIVNGNITNDVALVKTGIGAALLKVGISLPYKLSLKEGRIVTTANAIITLLPTCTIEADTITGTSFIDGPLIKQGLTNAPFLFPVGKSNQMRWVRLEQATGTFTVEYFKADPHSLGSTIGTGLDHISNVEYWDIQSSNTSNAIIKMSFKHPTSGGVTDLASLRVARNLSGIWQNAGNTNFSGSAGSNGWVSSSTVSGFSASTRYFALASAISEENPLPLYDLSFNARYISPRMLFTWKGTMDGQPFQCELQDSEDGITYHTFKSIEGNDSVLNYSIEFFPMHVSKFYRIKVRKSLSGAWHESMPVRMNHQLNEYLRIEGSNLVRDKIHLSVSTIHERQCIISIFNSFGELKMVVRLKLVSGSSVVSLNVMSLDAGMYTLSVIGDNRKYVSRFVKY